MLDVIRTTHSRNPWRRSTSLRRAPWRACFGVGHGVFHMLPSCYRSEE
jgi:hypothetical protein